MDTTVTSAILIVSRSRFTRFTYRNAHASGTGDRGIVSVSGKRTHVYLFFIRRKIRIE